MDEDTPMQEARSHDYPDPTGNVPAPYPFISGLGIENLQREIGGSNGNPVPTSGPSIMEVAQQYTSLSDYSNLGGTSSRSRLPTSQGLVENDVSDSEMEAEPQGRPLPNLDIYADAQRSRSSLPGYHLLPEENELTDEDFVHQSIQQRSLSVTDPQDSSSRGRGLDASLGRGRGRSRGRARGRGRGRGGWKWALKGTGHADLFATPRLKRKPGDKPRGRPRGQRNVVRNGGYNEVDPSHEFKEFQARATMAFLDGDLDEAHHLASQALKVNPEVFEAYSLLAQVLEAQGRDLEALSALQMGAVTVRDPALWITIAERLLALEGDERMPNYVEHALYCYDRAIKIDKTNYEARTEKLKLLEQQENWFAARKTCTGLMRIRPDDIETVKRYAEICYKLGQPLHLERAKDAYAKAFELYADRESCGDPDEQWTHLNIYADLIDKASYPTEGIGEIKRVARWFLGRKDETFWDDIMEDDREYDTTHERRAYIGQFQQGRASRDNAKYGEGLPLELRVKLGLFRLKQGAQYHAEAWKHFGHLTRMADEAEDFIELFFDVAEALRGWRIYGQAAKFYEPIKSTPDLPIEFWIGLGDCYKALDQIEDAEECYEVVVEEDEDNVDAQIELAKLYISTGKQAKAIPIVERLDRSEHRKRVRRDDALGQVARSKGKRMQEEKEKMLKTTAPVDNDNAAFPTFQNNITSRRIASRPTDEIADDEFEDNNDADAEFRESPEDVRSPAVRKRKKPVKNPGAVQGEKRTEYWHFLQEQKARIYANYIMVKELWPIVEIGQDEKAIQQWMEHASAMVQEFRSVKVFYTSESRVKRPTGGIRRGWVAGGSKVTGKAGAQRDDLESGSDGDDDDAATPTPVRNENTPRDFCEISFPEWNHIMVDLALLYAKNVDQDKCYDMVQDGLMTANVFLDDPQLLNTSLATCISCALIFNDTKFLLLTVKQYIMSGRYRAGMTYRLLAACGRLCYGEHYFNDSKKMASWFLRLVKIFDYASMSPELRNKFDWGMHKKHLDSRFKAIGETDDGLNPGVLMIYGHMLSTSMHSNTGATALSYFFRALALQPENIAINLTIATTFVANAMRSNPDNRQRDISQGLAFLYRYYDLRVASGRACHLQEAEYNIARTWHLLGLTHLAIPQYEKVLKLSEKVRQEKAEDEEDERDDDDTEDFAKEAAFALQSILMLSGNAEAAQAVTEEWLVM